MCFAEGITHSINQTKPSPDPADACRPGKFPDHFQNMRGRPDSINGNPESNELYIKLAKFKFSWIMNNTVSIKKWRV